MKNCVFFTAYFFLSLNLFAQTQRFSSENIDSLLSAYNSHQSIGLPKAYCLDQIVRFYSNSPRDLEKASEYIKAYKSISEALESTDLTTRYQYRNAKLDFLLSGNQVLDTTAYSIVYEYFKANDPAFCLDISSAMVNYISKRDDHYLDDDDVKNILAYLKWMELAGDDHLFNNDPLNAGQYYWICGQEASLENSKRGQLLCRKAIKAYLKGDASRSKIFEAYLWLSDLVFDSKDISNIYVLEKEVKTIDDERITSEFYSTLERYKGDLSQEEKNELKAQQLLSVRNSSIVVDLPQGQFFFDEYDEEGLREHLTIKIFGDTISRGTMDTSGILYNTTYKVIRSYPVRGKITVLAVDLLEEDRDNSQYYTVMHYLNNRLVLGDIYDYGGTESLLERESKIDEMLIYVKNEEILNDKRYDSLISLSTAYFSENDYASISKLPRISEDQFEELRTTFSMNLEPSDVNGHSAYEQFIGNANGQFEAADSELVMLREMMIEKGFNPFSSIPYFIFKEASKVSRFEMLLSGVNYIYMILGVGAVIWAIYRFIKSLFGRKKKNPEALAQPQISFLRRLKNFVGIGVLMIAGGSIGFWTGWSISDNGNGGGTIITIGVALFFSPVGAILGFFLGRFLLLKRKKTDNKIFE